MKKILETNLRTLCFLAGLGVSAGTAVVMAQLAHSVAVVFFLTAPVVACSCVAYLSGHDRGIVEGIEEEKQLAWARSGSVADYDAESCRRAFNRLEADYPGTFDQQHLG